MPNNRVSTQVNRAKLQHAAKLIRAEVAFFNGWSVCEETLAACCEKAATKVIRYLKQYEKRRAR